ncbi:CHASE2 domain-containing protein [Gemmatimonadota bacterium]
MTKKNKNREKVYFSKYNFPLLGLVLTLVLVIAQYGPFNYSDNRLLDLAFKIRGPRPAQENLVILGLDEESFRNVDAPLSLWSGKFAGVLDCLARAETRVVGFDLIQSNSFETYIAEDNQQLLEVIDEISTDGRMGLVFAYLPEKNLYPFEELSYLLAEFNGLGYSNLTLDDDKIVRRHELFALNEDNLIPSFPLLVCAKYMGEKPEKIIEKHLYAATGNPSIKLPKTVLINFCGPGRTIPRFSFASVLSRMEKGDQAFFRKHFSGKIVLIGLDTTGDMVSVSYSGNWNQSVLMPGVEIHANTINTILSGETIREISPFVFGGTLFLLAAVLLCVVFARISMGRGIGLSIALVVLLLIAWKALFAHNLFLGISAPLALILLAPLASYSYRFLVEDRDKRRLRKIFRTYVNEQVLEELVSREDYTAFRVQRKDVTLMFTDVRNFTTISEPLDPELTARLLNEYMSEMCKAIFEFNGTVNKFIGDGIMAIWGAPVDDPQSCLNAVKAALKMMERLAKLNRRWELSGYPEFNIGIGIHHANVAVGYLGHPDRMEYTALGDGVNCASRVEGLNKKLKTNILITDAVYKIVKEKIRVSKPQTLSIRGRSDVQVFPVSGMKGE